MLKVDKVDCDNWSNTVLKEIENKTNFNLESVFYRNYNQKKIGFNNSIKVFKNNITSLQSLLNCFYTTIKVRDAGYRKI